MLRRTHFAHPNSCPCALAMAVSGPAVVWANCWQPPWFTWETCCHPSFGPMGNADCWDSAYTSKRCCGEVGAPAPQEALAGVPIDVGGHTGGASQHSASSMGLWFAEDPGANEAWTICQHSFVVVERLSEAYRLPNPPPWLRPPNEDFSGPSACTSGAGKVGSISRPGRYFSVAQIGSHAFVDGAVARPGDFFVRAGFCVPRNCSESAVGHWLFGLAIQKRNALGGSPPPPLALPVIYPSGVRHVWQLQAYDYLFMLLDSEVPPLSRQSRVFFLAAMLLLLPAVIATGCHLLARCFPVSCGRKWCFLVSASAVRGVKELLAAPHVHHNWVVDFARICLVALVVHDHVWGDVDWQSGPTERSAWRVIWLIGGRINDGFVVLSVYNSGVCSGAKRSSQPGNVSARHWPHARRALVLLLSRWARVAPLVAFWTLIYLGASEGDLHTSFMLQSPRLYHWYEVERGSCKQELVPSILLATQPLFRRTPCHRTRIFETVFLLSSLVVALRALGVGARGHASLYMVALAAMGALEAYSSLPACLMHFHSILKLLPAALASAWAVAVDPEGTSLPLFRMGCVATLAMGLGGIGIGLVVATWVELDASCPIPFTATAASPLPLHVGLVLVLRFGERRVPPTALPKAFALPQRLVVVTRRALSIASRLGFGVNACNHFIFHGLNVVALSRFPEMLTVTPFHVLAWCSCVSLIGALVSTITFVLVEAPWKNLIRATFDRPEHLHEA